MKRIFTFTLFLSSVFISGCDIDLSQSNDSKEPPVVVDIVMGTFQIGGIRNYKIIRTTDPSKSNLSQHLLEKTTSVIEQDLPSDYAYQDPNGGPYIKIMTSYVGTTLVLSNYINASANLALSLGPNTYSTGAHIEHVSERDSSSLNYTLGQPYQVTDNRKSYFKYNHVEASNTQSVTTYIPKLVENVLVESGEYRALRIDYSAERSIQYSQQSDEMQKTMGSQWIDVLSGKIVKETWVTNTRKTAYTNSNNSIVYFTRTHISDIIPSKSVGTLNQNKTSFQMKSLHY